ncbi:MAG: hypothetical protein E1N59_1765 [Puniceicoccaceae bacterium 5H]|nr:MAG: hypothetical protein E1N59_1765 [Puniceicoccaceae bacterium 5H]
MPSAGRDDNSRHAAQLRQFVSPSIQSRRRQIHLSFAPPTAFSDL